LRKNRRINDINLYYIFNVFALRSHYTVGLPLPRRAPNLPCHATQGIFQILAEAELLALAGKSCVFLGT
jgi:hypothetical protein